MWYVSILEWHASYVFATRVLCIVILKSACLCDWQNGLDTKVERSRKQMKERKNRAKKIRGVKKVRLLVTLNTWYPLFFYCAWILKNRFLFNVCRQRLVIPRRSEILKTELVIFGSLFCISNLLWYLCAVRSFLQQDLFTKSRAFRFICFTRYLFHDLRFCSIHLFKTHSRLLPVTPLESTVDERIFVLVLLHFRWLDWSDLLT